MAKSKFIGDDDEAKAWDIDRADDYKEPDDPEQAEDEFLQWSDEMDKQAQERKDAEKFTRTDHLSNRERALAAIASTGVDVSALVDKSEAYLVSYAEARTDGAFKADAFSEDQERDAHGMWTSGGGGGDVKEHAKAADRRVRAATRAADNSAENAHDFAKNHEPDMASHNAHESSKFADRASKYAGTPGAHANAARAHAQAADAHDITSKSYAKAGNEKGALEHAHLSALHAKTSVEHSEKAEGKAGAKTKDPEMHAEANGVHEEHGVKLHDFDKEGGDHIFSPKEVRLGVGTFESEHPAEIAQAVAAKFGPGAKASMKGDVVTVEHEGKVWKGNTANGGEDGVTFKVSPKATGAAAGVAARKEAEAKYRAGISKEEHAYQARAIAEHIPDGAQDKNGADVKHEAIKQADAAGNATTAHEAAQHRMYAAGLSANAPAQVGEKHGGVGRSPGKGEGTVHVEHGPNGQKAVITYAGGHAYPYKINGIATPGGDAHASTLENAVTAARFHMNSPANLKKK